MQTEIFKNLADVMKMGLVIAGIVIVIILALGAYYVVSKSGSHGLSNYNSTPTQYSTTGYSTSVPKNSSTTSSQVTTTVGQNVTTTINSNSYTVNIANSATFGTYLTNGTGYTLYYFKSDGANSGISDCNGGCASAWPPFYVATLDLPQNLSASNFNTITRTDGTKQLTYNGLPLYFFRSDTKSGEVSGNGVSGFVIASTSSN